jgi:hypothetical protein
MRLVGSGAALQQNGNDVVTKSLGWRIDFTDTSDPASALKKFVSSRLCNAAFAA